MFGPNIHGSYSLFTLSKNLKPVKPRSGVSVGRANCHETFSVELTKETRSSVAYMVDTSSAQKVSACMYIFSLPSYKLSTGGGTAR